MGLVSNITAEQKPLNIKMLHLTFHKGCALEIEAMAKELSIDLTTWYIHDLPPLFFDGMSKGSTLYNIGHDRAEKIWNLHRDFFEQFDLILTSDTAPLARIFLQNHSKIPLVIWICNRFDYCDYASLDCHFPDPEFYRLFRRAKHLNHIRFVGYTPFEHTYTKMKRVDTGQLTIKPAGLYYNPNQQASSIPKTINKNTTFFIPPYLNDAILPPVLGKLDIPFYRGRYAGRNDLKDFKGIIHIPYAWSNVALFENWESGLVYFIPSENFLKTISIQYSFFWSPPFKPAYLHQSEWYLPEHQNHFVYFDSWDDLKYKIQHTDFEQKSQQVQQFAQKHKQRTLNAWHQLIYELSSIKR
ncbi:MAG: hypothetical protein K9M07_04870 [Simkaniaceae bacterium]|nr:hypothetical protein [Simkaniaceae bacterium]